MEATTEGRARPAGARRRGCGWGVAAVAMGTLALLDAAAAFVPPMPTTTTTTTTTAAIPCASAPAAPDSTCSSSTGGRQRPSSSSPPLVVLRARAKAAAGGGGEEKGPAKAKKSSSSGSGSGSKKKTTTATAASAGAGAAPLAPVPEGSALYDEALLEGGLAHGQRYEGDKKFNLRGQSEDVIAPWSVGGFEIDIPDWRPQPSEEYEVDAPQAVLDSLGKIENMFGASLRLVSTKDGVWRFFYYGHIRNLIGAEAWTKLLLQEDLKVPGVKEVRFETNYVRDYPDDWN